MATPTTPPSIGIDESTMADLHILDSSGWIPLPNTATSPSISQFAGHST